MENKQQIFKEMHFGQSIDKQQYQSCLCKSTVIFTEDENEKGGFGYIKYIINKLYSDCRIDLVQYRGADKILNISKYFQTNKIKYDLVIVLYDGGRTDNGRWDQIDELKDEIAEIVNEYCNRLVFITPVCFEELIQQTYYLTDIQNGLADGKMLKAYRDLIDASQNDINFRQLGKTVYQQTEQFVENEISIETEKQKYHVKHKSGLQKCWMTECSKCKIRQGCSAVNDECKYIKQVNEQLFYFIFIELQTLYNRKYIRDDALQSFRNNRNNKIIDRILEVRK